MNQVVEESFKRLESLSSNSNVQKEGEFKWEFVKEKHRVRIYQNNEAEKRSCKGVGLLEISPKMLLPFLWDISSHKLLSKMVEEVKILREIDNHTRILYIKSQSKFNSLPRDLTVLASFQECKSDGSFSMIIRSIDLSNPIWKTNDPRPPHRDESKGLEYESQILNSSFLKGDQSKIPMLRSTIFLSGFVVRPVQINGHKEKASNVTFIHQHSEDLLPTQISHKANSYFALRIARLRQSIPENLKLKQQNHPIYNATIAAQQRRAETERYILKTSANLRQMGSRSRTSSMESLFGSENESNYSSSWSTSSSEDEHYYISDREIMKRSIDYSDEEIKVESYGVLLSEKEAEEALSLDSITETKSGKTEEKSSESGIEKLTSRLCDVKKASKPRKSTGKVISKRNNKNRPIIFFFLLLWSLIVLPLWTPMRALLLAFLHSFKENMPGCKVFVGWMEGMVPKSVPLKLVSNAILIFTFPFLRWALASILVTSDSKLSKNDTIGRGLRVTPSYDGKKSKTLKNG
eukprot:TRINITY_DN3262_c0_g1_i1.p1 TRINITY_DN3262_c0_g1~~TRINITY_DN3262_c0_g1_i1.p1  ORF type:complete len:520 (-),score=137.95 TRINITY_DN3262_c0_g1_i1:328-1887(-)